jgi:hypothetical protein
LKFLKLTGTFFNKFFYVFFTNIFIRAIGDIGEIHKKEVQNSEKIRYDFTVKSINDTLRKSIRESVLENNVQQKLYYIISDFLSRKTRNINYTNRYKKKKRNSIFSQYSFYRYNINKHPFYSLIKYEYNLYLKKNPYNIESSDYYNYSNYSNFIK